MSTLQGSPRIKANTARSTIKEKSAQRLVSGPGGAIGGRASVGGRGVGTGARDAVSARSARDVASARGARDVVSVRGEAASVRDAVVRSVTNSREVVKGTLALSTMLPPESAPIVFPTQYPHAKLESTLQEMMQSTRIFQATVSASVEQTLSSRSDVKAYTDELKLMLAKQANFTHSALAKTQEEDKIRSFELEKLQLQQAHELKRLQLEIAEREAAQRFKIAATETSEIEARKRKRQEEAEEMEHQLKMKVLAANAAFQIDVLEQKRLQSIEEARMRRLDDAAERKRQDRGEDQRHFEAMSFNRSYGGK